MALLDPCTISYNRTSAPADPRVTKRLIQQISVQNHSPGMYWSRINMERDRRRPIPLNRATVINASMLAIDVAEARGRSLAIAVFISFLQIF